MTPIFSVQATTPIVFGTDSISNAASVLKAHAIACPLVVVDRNLAATGHFQRMLVDLRKQGLTVQVWERKATEPTTEAIVPGIDAYLAGNCDGLVGCGGGSTLDTAKAIGVLAYCGGSDPTPYGSHGTMKISGCAPVIAIPTTCGTGSEVTSMAMLTVSGRPCKLLLRHTSLRPRAAIIDPMLMATQPAAVVLSSAMDALSHAIECFTKDRDHPYADGLAATALKRVLHHLPRAMAGSEDGLPHLAAAACIAGLAFDAGGLQFHALSHVLGARYHLPHGLCCAMVLLAGLSYLLPRVPGKLAYLMPVVAPDVAATDMDHAAATVVNGVVAFIDRMKIPYPRQVCDIETALIDDLVQETMANGIRNMETQTLSTLWATLIHSGSSGQLPRHTIFSRTPLDQNSSIERR